MEKDKFTMVIDILGVIAFWVIAIGTMWSVYYTRLVYRQNLALMSPTVMVTTPNTFPPPTVDGPSVTIPSNPSTTPDLQDDNQNDVNVPL